MKGMIPFENGFQNRVGMIPIGVCFEVDYRRGISIVIVMVDGITILLQLGGKGL
jgi:hypothetical protein